MTLYPPNVLRDDRARDLFSSAPNPDYRQDVSNVHIDHSTLKVFHQPQDKWPFVYREIIQYTSNYNKK